MGGNDVPDPDHLEHGDIHLVVLAFGKAYDVTPVALGGATLAHLAVNGLSLQLRCQRLARRAAFPGFLVKLRRLAGRAAAGGKSAYDDDELERAYSDFELVADADVFRRLDAHPVEMRLAAFDRLCRQRARLEKSRRPQPFVDA